MSVLLSSFSVEMCQLYVTLLCFCVVWLVVLGTRVAVTHDQYLHNNYHNPYFFMVVNSKEICDKGDNIQGSRKTTLSFEKWGKRCFKCELTLKTSRLQSHNECIKIISPIILQKSAIRQWEGRSQGTATRKRIPSWVAMNSKFVNKTSFFYQQCIIFNTLGHG